MHLSLLKKLIDLNIIHEDTEIEAFYGARDLSGSVLSLTRGTFYVRSVESTDDGYVFLAVSTVNGRLRRIHSKHLLKIDGMEPDRLAEVYFLTAEGTPVKQGKRRGRKPRAKEIA